MRAGMVARPAAGRAVGREAARGRPDRGGVHRPGAAAGRTCRRIRACRPDHARGARAAWRGRALLPADDARAADPRRPHLAHGAGHAAHHLGRAAPAELPEAPAAALLRAARGGARRRLTWPGCVPPWTHGRRGARGLRPACGGDRGAMSVAEGDPAPEFAMPATGGRTVSLAALKGKPFVLYFYPEGRHARLHQGGLRVPGGAAAARQDRHRGDRRLAGQDEADREIRREIRADVSAGLRRGHQGGRRPTACGSRNRCTAANTWAWSAARS